MSGRRTGIRSRVRRVTSTAAGRSTRGRRSGPHDQRRHQRSRSDRHDTSARRMRWILLDSHRPTVVHVALTTATQPAPRPPARRIQIGRRRTGRAFAVRIATASIADRSACRGRGSRRCGRSRSAAGVRPSRSPAAARSPSSNARRNEVVAAYDVMTGRELWTNAWPERFSQWMGGGEGPRATPAWADGLVYALGAGASCAASTRRPARSSGARTSCRMPARKISRWGMAASPLIAGDAVIVLPGGPSGQSVAAYDRRTGKAVVDGARRSAGLRRADAGHAPRRTAIPDRQRQARRWD